MKFKVEFVEMGMERFEIVEAAAYSYIEGGPLEFMNAVGETIRSYDRWTTFGEAPSASPARPDVFVGSLNFDPWRRYVVSDLGSSAQALIAACAAKWGGTSMLGRLAHQSTLSQLELFILRVAHAAAELPGPFVK